MDSDDLDFTVNDATQPFNAPDHDSSDEKRLRRESRRGASRADSEENSGGRERRERRERRDRRERSELREKSEGRERRARREKTQRGERRRRDKESETSIDAEEKKIRRRERTTEREVAEEKSSRRRDRHKTGSETDQVESNEPLKRERKSERNTRDESIEHVQPFESEPTVTEERESRRRRRREILGEMNINDSITERRPTSPSRNVFDDVLNNRKLQAKNDKEEDDWTSILHNTLQKAKKQGDDERRRQLELEGKYNPELFESKLSTKVTILTAFGDSGQEEESGEKIERSTTSRARSSRRRDNKEETDPVNPKRATRRRRRAEATTEDVGNVEKVEKFENENNETPTPIEEGSRERKKRSRKRIKEEETESSTHNDEAEKKKRSKSRSSRRRHKNEEQEDLKKAHVDEGEDNERRSKSRRRRRRDDVDPARLKEDTMGENSIRRKASEPNIDDTEVRERPRSSRRRRPMKVEIEENSTPNNTEKEENELDEDAESGGVLFTKTNMAEQESNDGDSDQNETKINNITAEDISLLRATQSNDKLAVTRKVDNLLHFFSFTDPKAKAPQRSQKHSKFDEETTLHITQKISRAVLNLTVHHSDLLQLHPNVVHPYIRVSSVDISTGQLLKKHDFNRSAVANFEYLGKEKQCEYIIPTMIPPYNMRSTQSLIPQWESTVFFDQDYDHFLQPDVVIVFEIFDFETKDPSKFIRSEGVKKVAWAFLHPLSMSGRSNTEKRLRLQLYKYPRTPISKIFTIGGAERTIALHENFPYADVVNLYRIKSKKKYPSTLHVTLAARDRPEEEVVSKRPQHQLQEEVGSLTYEEMCRMYTSHWAMEDMEMEEILDDKENRKLTRRMNKLRRAEKERCTIPTKKLYQFDVGGNGCLSLAFSRSNEHIACGCANVNSTATIRVYNVFTGKLAAEYDGHLSSLIYSIDWSPKDNLIASASGDATARIWTFGKKKQQLFNIQHPAYVYAAKFHPKFGIAAAKTNIDVDNILVTGSFDHKIRFFVLSSKGNFQPILIKELSIHSARVNSISFDPSGLRIFTADGSGIINVLSARVEVIGEEGSAEVNSTSSDSELEARPSSHGGYTVDISTLDDSVSHSTVEQLKSWIASPTLFSCIKTINNPELTKASITVIRPDPRNPENRLMIHSQDNLIRLLDLNTQSILKRYSGVKCHINSQKSQISPDGRYIITGSNSGKVYVWTKDAQKLLHPEGLDFGFMQNPVFDIVWASEYHIVALCSYGNPEPIRIYSIPFNDDEDEQPVIESRSFITDTGKKLFGRFSRLKTPARTENFKPSKSDIQLDKSPRSEM